ncbi:MAG: hypothetical protein IJE54_01735 [Peptococcaceae bacterium]|nr:hypothetical protein [Peptococcaceae bacterium]
MKKILRVNAMLNEFENCMKLFEETNAKVNVLSSDEMNSLKCDIPGMLLGLDYALTGINLHNEPQYIDKGTVEIEIYRELYPYFERYINDDPANAIATKKLLAACEETFSYKLPKLSSEYIINFFTNAMINASLTADENEKIERQTLTDTQTLINSADEINDASDSEVIEMDSDLTAEELAYLTGLTKEQCQYFMDVNNMSGDEALEAIDIFMQSLNDNVAVPVEVAGCLRNAGIYTEMAGRLNAYNTMRGSTKGYYGFVFEEMHAADLATKGVDIKVLGNNGIADFIVKDASGKEILVQSKAGYGTGKIDWNKYKDQTIIVDKGNKALAAEAKAAGLKVQESAIFKEQAQIVARAQQWESKVTGNIHAPITGTAVSAHTAGLASAKLAARVGVSMKLGENIYDVVSGNKDFADAAADVVVDGAVLIGGAYVTTAALTAAGTAVTAAGTALAGTAAGAVVTGAASTAAAAVGSTAVGGAVITGAGTAVAAVGTAVSAVATAPLVPVVAAGAVIGFVGKLITDRW